MWYISGVPDIHFLFCKLLGIHVFDWKILKYIMSAYDIGLSKASGQKTVGSNVIDAVAFFEEFCSECIVYLVKRFTYSTEHQLNAQKTNTRDVDSYNYLLTPTCQLAYTYLNVMSKVSMEGYAITKRRTGRG